MAARDHQQPWRGPVIQPSGWGHASSPTVAKAAPDGRISQVFCIRSKRDERLMFAIIPIDAVLVGVLLGRGERGLALVMAGATAVAAVRLWVARKRRGARDVRPVP
ncbi:hypothetical protein AMK14_14625 [Streptomyces sp. TSRI0445]|nr:hypothetical protein AMK14_14625 [Streptomyces sp. TSRI0445]